MSDLAKIIRSNPIGAAALNAVGGIEQTVVHVGVPTVATALQGAANAALTSALGSGAAIAEPMVDDLIAEFSAWLQAKL